MCPPSPCRSRITTTISTASTRTSAFRICGMELSCLRRCWLCKWSQCGDEPFKLGEPVLQLCSSVHVFDLADEFLDCCIRPNGVLFGFYKVIRAANVLHQQ